MKQLWFFVVVGAAIVVRLIFLQNALGYQATADSYSYFRDAQSIAQTGQLADPWRLPVYPLIIRAAFMINGQNILREPNIFTYHTELWFMRVAQHVAGVATVILLWYFLMQAATPLWVTVAATGIVAIHPEIFAFERAILTESFYTVLLLGMLVLLQSLLRRYRVGLLLVLCVFCIVGVFLRPIMIGLPFIFFVFIGLRYRTRHVVVGVVVCTVLYVMALGVYSASNYRTAGYFGISRIGDVNLIGKILHYQLPIETIPDAGGAKEIIRSYRQDPRSPDPWGVLDRHPELYRQKAFASISMFSRNVILGSWPLFVWRAVLDVPGSISVISQSAEFPTGGNPLLQMLWAIGPYLVIVNWGIVPALGFLLYEAIRRRRPVSWSVLILVATCVYFIASTVTITYDDYGRILLVILPLLCSLFFWSVWRGSILMKKKL